MNKDFFIKNNYLESTKRVNTLPFSSYFIPFDVSQDFSFKKGIIDREKSNRFISLDGIWNIKEHNNLFEIKDIDEDLDINIEVPSCVQLHGFDYNQYINVRYPFPYNPPHVPEHNPAYHYRRTFNITELGYYELCFDGVDSAFYVFINHQFVGYSQITHSLSKFDISKYLKLKENTIDVIVIKWCASSYLEDQDKFRFTGIIRSVYLLKRDDEHITDFKIETNYIGDKGEIIITNLSNVDITINCLDIVKKISPNQKETLVINHPVLWSSENPYLYDVVISSKQEKILQKVGIRKVEIDQGIFKINNQHIKLKGVNRHEFHPERGSAISFTDTYNDLLIVKSLNANAIRTSHYPDMPEFYELCDVLGIYVVDEADLETHGVTMIEGGYDRKLWQEFANNGLYDDAVTDREISLYERDKNHTCVIIWSLGNESSYGKMFYLGADYIHCHDNRPIHYEGAWEMVDREEYYNSRIDIASRMYPEISWLANEYLNDKKETRPLMLCEYSHSMGNSNGDLSDYWKVINSNDRFIGAFVWELFDHAINENGKLLYGGDFNEQYHDGNFCVDGLLGPYREMKTNALELKAVYEGKLDRDEPVNKCKPLKPLENNNPLKVIFDDINGSVCLDELTSPIKINYLRALTDNDQADLWKLKDLISAKVVVKLLNKDSNYRKYHISVISENYKDNLIDIDLSFVIYNKAIDIKIDYQINDEFEYTPRIGVSFAINKIDEFRFFGYGKDESYIDKCIHNKMGEFKVKVNDNYKHYLKPQESGSHYYSSHLDLGDIYITAFKPFSFNVLPYSQEMLGNTKHDFELRETGDTYIYLDVNMRGIGTHSCGPELLEKYRIRKKDSNTFRLEFRK